MSVNEIHDSCTPTSFLIPFPLQEIRKIKQLTMAKLIRRNTGFKSAPDNVFYQCDGRLHMECKTTATCL